MKVRHVKRMPIPFYFLVENLDRLCINAGNVIDDIQLSGFFFIKKILLIGMTFGVMTTAVAEIVTIHPASPTSFESVVARIHDYNMCLNGFPVTQVKQAGTTIKVYLEVPNCDIGFVPLPSSIRDVDIKLGQFPSGVFNVDFFVTIYQSGSTGITPQETQIGSAQFTVTDNNAAKTRPFPLVDYTDHWWNPQESGMGFSIMQHPSDRIFAAWFVYDQAGQPTWYTLQPGEWLSSTVYSGPIYKTTGTYLGATYNPGQLVVTPVGTGTFRETLIYSTAPH